MLSACHSSSPCSVLGEKVTGGAVVLPNTKNSGAGRQTGLSPPGQGQGPESARPGYLLFRCEVLGVKNQHAVAFKCLLEHIDGCRVGYLPQVNPFDLSPKDRLTGLTADCH